MNIENLICCGNCKFNLQGICQKDKNIKIDGGNLCKDWECDQILKEERLFYNKRDIKEGDLKQ